MRIPRRPPRWTMFDTPTENTFDLIHEPIRSSQLPTLHSCSYQGPFTFRYRPIQNLPIPLPPLGGIFAQGQVTGVLIQPFTPLDTQVMSRTGPGIRLWHRHHPRAHRIHLDIPIASQQIFVTVHGARFIATLPQGAGPAFQTVVISQKLGQIYLTPLYLTAPATPHPYTSATDSTHTQSTFACRFSPPPLPPCPVSD